MLKKLMSMRLVAAGVILLAAVSFTALSGCAVVISHYNGHWVESKDSQGNITRRCEPGGRECTVLGVEQRRSVN